MGRDLIDAQTLYSERDEERDCTIFDEDQVLDEMEGFMAEGGNVIDFHSSDFFPERFFDLVFVLRTNNEVLYERLEERWDPISLLFFLFFFCSFSFLFLFFFFFSFFFFPWFLTLFPFLLGNRGYSQKKVQENIEAEIMQVVLDEAVESYRREIIHILEVFFFFFCIVVFL